MKFLNCLFLLFATTIFAQNEEIKLNQYTSEFENANSIVSNNESTVEKSISYFDEKINATKDVYLKNAFLLYKAKEERRLDIKTSLVSLNKVKNYIDANPSYLQLKSFYNSIYGRILFEAQKDCEGSYEVYNENLNILSEIKKPFLPWNVVLESKTGIISSLICLQKDIEALEYLKQLEKEINTKTQLKEYIFVITVAGFINTKLSNYNEGEKYFLKGIKLLENTKEHQDNYLAITNNLGHIYKVTEQTDKGIALLEKGLAKAKQLKDVNNEYLISNNLGFLYVKKERYKEAEKLGLFVLKNASEKDFGFHIANANRLLGTVYYHLANYNNAKKHADAAIEYYRNFKNPEYLRHALDIKNKLLIKTEQFEDAAKVNSEIISLLDSVSLNTNIQSLQKNLIEYETEKKDNEITILKQKDEISNFKIDKQRQYIYFLFIGLVGITILGLIVFLYQKKINIIQNLSLRSKLTRSQFNPHYINNAFTSLQATLVENNLDENLIDYTSNVSRFSRLLLESTFKDEWTLFEEKQMMENYLKTQLYRLEDGFDYSIDTNLQKEELHALKVPSALTQTALENAIEHGGFKNNSNGEIKVSILKNNDHIEIQIQNNILENQIQTEKKMENEPSRGLEITKQRVELHSKIHKLPTDFSFTKNGDVALVTFTLPLLPA